MPASCRPEFNIINLLGFQLRDLDPFKVRQPGDRRQPEVSLDSLRR